MPGDLDIQDPARSCRRHDQRAIHLLAISTLIWLLAAGCTRSVPIPSDFPTPVSERLPLRMGLYYDRLLRAYVYRKQTTDGTTWLVDLRPAHRPLFRQVFGEAFAQLREATDFAALTGAPGNLDAILAPQVEAFTLETPADSSSPFYQVTITYRIRLYSAKGEIITSWPIEGYGRGRAGWLQSGRAVKQATVQALRDVAAQIVIGIANSPGIAERLAAKQPKPTRDTGTIAE